MSNQWKTALRFGLVWGILTALIMTALDAWEKYTSAAFMTWKFAVKVVVLLILGIAIGYYNWKQKQQEQQEAKS
jgi:uncharacterized membrane protein